MIVLKVSFFIKDGGKLYLVDVKPLAKGCDVVVSSDNYEYEFYYAGQDFTLDTAKSYIETVKGGGCGIKIT